LRVFAAAIDDTDCRQGRVEADPDEATAGDAGGGGLEACVAETAEAVTAAAAAEPSLVPAVPS